MRRLKGPIWPYLVFGLLTISLLSSCATWKVAKKEVWPGVRQAIVGAGPHLAEAILTDIFALIGYPVELTESLVTPAKEEVKPTTP